MRFFKRHRYLLSFLVLLTLCIVAVQWQFLDRESAQVRLRENFIELHRRGLVKPSERLYQVLIQRLPRDSDAMLLDNLQRTSMFVSTNAPHPDNLVWKYHVGIQSELNQRLQKRLPAVLEEIGK